MKHLRPALILTVLFVVFAGIAFPYAITAIANVAMPHQSTGSMVKSGDKEIGSELIGQTFTKPEYLHPRPSAAGNGYDANNSGATNLGPTNPKLLEGADGFDGIKKLAADYRKENHLAESDLIPADAVTRSASGLDPDISPRNAKLQAKRIALARAIPVDRVLAVIAEHTECATLGIFGEPKVNVLAVNIQLDSDFKAG